MVDKITQTMIEDCSDILLDIAEGLLRNAPEHILDALMDAVCLRFSETVGDDVTMDDIKDLVGQFEDRIISFIGEPYVEEPEFIDDDFEDDEDLEDDDPGADEEVADCKGTVTLSLNVTRRITGRRAKLFEASLPIPVVNACLRFNAAHNPFFSLSEVCDEDITDREVDTPYDSLEDK